MPMQESMLDDLFSSCLLLPAITLHHSIEPKVACNNPSFIWSSPASSLLSFVAFEFTCISDWTWEFWKYSSCSTLILSWDQPKNAAWERSIKGMTQWQIEFPYTICLECLIHMPLQICRSNHNYMLRLLNKKHCSEISWSNLVTPKRILTRMFWMAWE